jgi:hypothetical protein
MPQVTERARQAHQQATRYQIADIANYLRELLGQRLVAFAAGVNDSKAVAAWSDGSRVPRPEAERRLRLAFQVFHLLQAQESPHTVRAWFVGINPQLNDESPAEAIREGKLKDVWTAAQAYVAGG